MKKILLTTILTALIISAHAQGSYRMISGVKIYDTTKLFPASTGAFDCSTPDKIDSFAVIVHAFLGDTYSAKFVNALMHGYSVPNSRAQEYFYPIAVAANIIDNTFGKDFINTARLGACQYSVVERIVMINYRLYSDEFRYAFAKALTDKINYSLTGLNYKVNDYVKIGFDYKDCSERNNMYIIGLQPKENPKYVYGEINGTPFLLNIYSLTLGQ